MATYKTRGLRRSKQISCQKSLVCCEFLKEYLTKINFGKQNNVILYGIYQLDLQVLLQLQEQLSKAITALLVATAGIMFPDFAIAHVGTKRKQILITFNVKSTLARDPICLSSNIGSTCNKIQSIIVVFIPNQFLRLLSSFLPGPCSLQWHSL